MTNAISDLHNALIIMRTDNKATIKGMVAKLTEQGFDAALWDTKSKALFIDSVDAHAKELAESSLVTELDALKVDISKVINDAGKAAFELGSLLLKAREACDNQQEFLEWVDSNFGIKKAWAFKLMKVSQVFSGEPWTSVAVSVLYTLQAQASDEQLAEARKFAEAGKLDISTVKALLAPPLPVPAKPSATTEEPMKVSSSVQEALMSVEAKEVSTVVEVKPAAQEPVVSPVVDNSSSELLAKIADMSETIRQLTEQLAEANKPRLRQAVEMPMLPQFSSPCLYARLGLSADEANSKDKILEAFKALCKAGYGRQQVEAFALIDEARHELIKALEGAA